MQQQMYECHMNSITEPKRASLIDVWQSAAECGWRNHQQMEKATKSLYACRRRTSWTVIVNLL